MSFDRVIPPGEEGKIKVKVVTKGYGGNKYNKSIRVDTNDPNHAIIELKISGDIKTFAAIIPKSVYLSGRIGEDLSQVVKIIPETQEPFKIVKVTALNGTDIRHTLQEIEKSGNKFYELTIENTRQTPGRYFDTLNIVTDRGEQTSMNIYVRGNIRSDEEKQPDSPENSVAPPAQDAAPPGTESNKQ